MGIIGEKKVAIYGSGNFAKNFLRDNPAVNVSYVFDTNRTKQGELWRGFTIEDFSNYIDKILQNKLIIIITSTYYEEISSYLNSFGLYEGIHFIIYNGKSIEQSIAKSLIVKKFSSSLILNGLEFSDFKVSDNGFHVIGFSDNYVLKIEIGKDEQKKNDILKEIEIIKTLNQHNALSCPKIVFEGIFESYNYFIIERKIRYSRPSVPDLLLALLEQKSLGVYQGDLKPDNIIFDGDICYLIDYDQALVDESLKTMPFDVFLLFIKEYSEKTYGTNVFSVYSEYFDYENFQSYVKNGALKIGQTSLLRKQITTLETDGFYHLIQTPNVYLKGARDSVSREPILNKINFKHNEKVLDVGCNLGLLSMYLDKRGCEVIGIDLDPYVVKAAQMISNIEQGRARFKNIDIDLIEVEEKFDTVLLFSVLQHFNELEDTAKKISRLGNRIILELSLMESGMKPIDGEWHLTSKWNFKNQNELIVFLEELFQGFRFHKNYGETDRNRFILEFRKQDFGGN